MAVIPLVQPRERIDVPRTPTPSLAMQANPVADAMQDIGTALGNLAVGWGTVRSMDAEAEFQKFKLSETQRYDDTAFKLKPENAAGFATNYNTGYKERAEEWVTRSLPGAGPSEVKRWRARLGEVEISLFNKSIENEQALQFAFVTQKLNETLNTTIAPRAQSVAKLPDDANKAAALAAVEADAFALIDASALSEAQKEERKAATRLAIQSGFAAALPPAEKARLDPTTPDATVVDRILQVEGTAKNPKSSAQGPGQFVDETWLDLIKRYRPDLASGLTREEILDLRTGPLANQLGPEMVKALAAENSAYLQYNKIDATAGNLYLAHFLGAGGAVAMLNAPPGMSAAEINPEAAKANPRVFYHPKDGDRNQPDYTRPKTAAEVAEWAGALMGGTYHTDWGRTLDAIPYDQRINFAHDGSAALVNQQTATAAAAKAAYDARLNATKNAVLDNKYGLADLSNDYADGEGWLTDATDRSQLMEMIQKRDKETLNLADAQALMQGTATINPFDTDTQKAVNLWYDKIGGKGANLYESDGSGVVTLRAVVERTQMVPDAAKAQLLSGIYSPDPNRRDRAFAIMDGLDRQNSAAYTQAFTQTQRERVDIYQALKPLVSADVLAEEMNPMASSQQTKLREERRSEGQTIAGKIQDNEILGAFDETWLWGGVPSPPSDGLMQTALRSDFEAAFASAYARVPTEDAAKTLAFEWLKNKWGPTDVGTGGNVLMSFPPERYYPRVDGNYDWMDDQLETEVLRQFPKATAWWIVPIEQTTADIAARESGSNVDVAYGVMTFNETDGSYKPLGTPFRTGGPDSIEYSSVPAVVRFDYRLAQAEREARFMAERVGQAVTEAATAPPPSERPPVDPLIGAPLRGFIDRMTKPDPDDPAYRPFGDPNNPMGRGK